MVTETLEDRSLMAADAFAYWNSYIPSDVNVDNTVDIRDILSLVSEVNTNGFRDLSQGAAASQAQGEGETPPASSNPTLMIDVNRDGTFSIIDILHTIRDYSGEGEPPTAAMRVVGVPAGGSAVDCQTLGQVNCHTNGDVNGNPGNDGSTGGVVYDPNLTPLLEDVPGQTFDTGTEIVAAIKKGDKFELRVFVQDLQVDGPGLFYSPFDIGFNTQQVIPVVNEFQEIILTTGSTYTGGSFTVSYDGSAPVTVNASTNLGTMTTNLQTALRNLLGGANNVTVAQFDPPGNANPAAFEKYNWKVTFKGTLEGKNVARIVVNPANLVNSGATTTTATVNEFNGVFNGAATNATALKGSVFASPAGDSGNASHVFYNEFIKAVQYTPGVDKPDGLHEVYVGANFSLPSAGTIEREYMYIKMQSIDGTTDANGNVVPMSIQLNKPETNLPARYPTSATPDTFPTSQVDYGGAYKLVVLEGVSALADNISTTNSGTADGNGRFTLNVLQNNGNGADFSSDSTAFRLSAALPAGATSQGGTVVRLSDNTVGYTPPAGFQITTANDNRPGVITDTFTYSIEAIDVVKAANPYYRDTATVSVKLFVPNQKPVIGGVAPINISEGGSAMTSNLTVTDVDNDGATNITMNVTIVDGNNQPVAGELIVSGNSEGTASSFTLNDSLVNINTALANGVDFTPPVDFNGVLTITLVAHDNGSGIGSDATDTKTITVNVTGINDIPVITAPFSLGSIQDEDILSFTGPMAISVADVDANEGTGTHSLTFTVTAKLNNVTPHGSFSGGTAGTGTVQINGTLATLNAALAALQYTPDAAFLGDYTFSIVVSDNGNGTNGNPAASPQTAFHDMTLTVNPSARPKAVDDVYSLLEDGADIQLSPGVLGGATPDKVHPGQTAAVTAGSVANIVATPHASIAGFYVMPGVLPAGLITQTGDNISVNASLLPDFFGTIEFDYTLEDGVAPDAFADVTGHVTVTVTNVADAPRRNATPTTLINGTEETQVTLDLSSFFSDPDGDALTAVLDSENPASPAGTIGTTAINATQYTPAGNFFGLKTLSFKASDGTLQSTGTADVDVDFANVADKPVVQSFSIANFAEDPAVTPVTISLAGQITDPDGGTIDLANLTGLSVTPTIAGTVGTDANGLTFTPRANYHGPVSISYAIKDGDFPTNASLTSAPGTVTFTITAVNDAPVAADDTASVGEGQTIQINVTSNDKDVDTDTTNFVGVPGTVESNTTITITQQPAIGSASVVNGKIQYVAPAVVAVATQTTVKYTLTDPGTLVSNEVTVTIDVLPKNDPPMIGNVVLAKVVQEDFVGGLVMNLFTDGNVSDPDTAPSLWTIEVVTPPAHGTLALGANGAVTYSPALNYNGPDSFVYRIADNDTIAPTNLKSGNGTVNITVNETNDAPVAVNDTQPNNIGLIIVNDNNSLTNIIDVLANDNFGPDAPAIDGPLKLVSVGVAGKTAQGGDVIITADGKVSYKSPAGLKDFTDSFTYTIQDRNGTGLTATGTATFFVQEAVPVSINIDVFHDIAPTANSLGDGIRQANEVGYANVEISIVGTDFKGVVVDLRDANGQRFRTGADGKLTIPRLLPGTYHVQEIQPAMIQDSNDSSPDIRTTDTVVRKSLGNDGFDLVIPTVPAPNADLAIDLFFGELAMESQYRTLLDNLVSASNYGLNLGVNAAGNVTWSEVLGWHNVKSITGQLSADHLFLTLTITPLDGSPATTVSLSQTGTYRFTLSKVDANGNVCARINSTAQGLGLNQFV